MITTQSILLGKAAVKGGVVVVAVELAVVEVMPQHLLDQITSENFNAVAVGIGALAVAIAAVVTTILTNRSNRKNREQLAQIALDAAAALRVQADATAKIAHTTQNLEIKVDGRLEELLRVSKALADQQGQRTGEQRVRSEIADAAKETAERDVKVVQAVAGAVV